jgi:hypothetical protein
LLSSKFIIQDYDPVEKEKESDPLDITTKPIGIPFKNSYQTTSSYSRSIPDTPPFTSEAFSPPFSKPVMMPGSSATHKAFSSTPPFSQGSSSEPPMISPSSTSSFSSKVISITQQLKRLEPCYQQTAFIEVKYLPF